MNESGIDRGSLVWGALFTLTGLAFLGQELGWWSVRAGTFLPVALIVAGAILVVSTLRQATSS